MSTRFRVSVPAARTAETRSAPPGVERGAGGHGAVRCGCGSLLGRLVPEGVEVKCRRCKRTFVIPLEEEDPV